MLNPTQSKNTRGNRKSLPVAGQLLVGVDAAATMLGISTVGAYRQIKRGKLSVIRIGSRTLVAVAEIRKIRCRVLRRFLQRGERLTMSYDPENLFDSSYDERPLSAAERPAPDPKEKGPELSSDPDLMAKAPASTEKDSSTSGMCEQAETLAEQGFFVFRTVPDGDRGVDRNGKKLSPKRPHRFRWQEEATRDPKRVRELWTSVMGDPEDHNIGLAMGMPLDDEYVLVAIDVDNKIWAHVAVNGKTVRRGVADSTGAAVHANHKALEAKHGKLPRTVQAETTSGGQHRFFRVKKGAYIPNSQSTLSEFIDVKSEGGYVVGPGSIVDGKPYAFAEGHSPDDIEFAELPEAYVAAMTAKRPEKAVGKPIIFAKRNPVHKGPLPARSAPAHRPVCYARFTSTPAVGFAQIVLKNSIFRAGHNSEDRWQPRRKIL